MSTRRSPTKGMHFAPSRPFSWTYVSVFAIVVAAFVAAVVGLSSNQAQYRNFPIDLASLSESELILESGLNRSDVAAIKLGHVERSAPYDILMLGNHQFKFFGSDAFDTVAPDLRFFNLWYANLSISELADLTEFLASEGKLPTKLLLIQITSPNNDNGLYIVGSHGELLPDIREFSGETAGLSTWELLSGDYENAVNAVKRVVDYSRIIHALAGNRETRRVVDTQACDGADTQPVRDTRGLGTILSNLLGGAGGDEPCSPAKWIEAFRGDGSRNDRYVVADPTLDANPLEADRAHLTYADVPTLLKDMQRINKAAKTAGATAVFVIPPVYETPRESIVNRVMDLAIEKSPDIHFVDHRSMTRPKTLFVTYDHPSSAYFKALAEDLAARGYLSDTE